MVYCPQCLELVTNTDRFCRTCGYQLGLIVDNGRLSPARNIIPVNTKQTCPVCKHSGGTDPRGFGFSLCPVCHGRQFNLVPRDTPGCRKCGGTGIVQSERLHIWGNLDRICEICGGTGYSRD
jgi:hypothetical protein